MFTPKLRVFFAGAGLGWDAWVVKATGAYRYKIVYTEHCTRPKVYTITQRSRPDQRKLRHVRDYKARQAARGPIHIAQRRKGVQKNKNKKQNKKRKKDQKTHF